MIHDLEDRLQISLRRFGAILLDVSKRILVRELIWAVFGTDDVQKLLGDVAAPNGDADAKYEQMLQMFQLMYPLRTTSEHNADVVNFKPCT